MERVKLSDEQELFIETVFQGYNVLVNACIGSGKTTTIQELCRRYVEIPENKGKRILYLTYNKLLKTDARVKIKHPHVQVTNYHGFAYLGLKKIGVNSGVHELIQMYNKCKPETDKYSLLIIDEYQDIEEEFATMLEHIKACNEGIQIAVVGDMCQKIYDKTRLNVEKFIFEFIGQDCSRIEFTKCFRINSMWAEALGNIWGKKIVGVNQDCQVKWCSYNDYRLKELLLNTAPKDMLCLGQNNGQRSAMLNYLETTKPEVFNKYTVWSNTSDNDAGSTQPSPDCAIFTTYDGCKGMERPLCVVFDWSEAYWAARTQKPDVKYEIIRNIFCVAASRGKHKIIFVSTTKDERLKNASINGSFVANPNYEDQQISKMFDFKYIEDVEDAYKCLDTKMIQPQDSVIDIQTSDGLIDLSSCIGIYQEAAYFNEYNISKDIQQFFNINCGKEYLKVEGYEDWAVDDQILYLVSLETNQDRYMKQVKTPFVTEDEWKLVEQRLATHFTRDEYVQKECQLEFCDENGKPMFDATGFCDVVKERMDGKPGNAVYELKFVEELSHIHFLQCACYMVSLNYSVGYLWNVKDNQMYEITIPDRQGFLNKVVKAVTKGHVQEFRGKRKVRNVVKANTAKIKQRNYNDIG